MGRSQSQQEQRLLELLNAPVNRNKCGECKENDPTWASWNLGVFLCGRCASAHRALGPDISVVKSLSMENWSSHELSTMAKIGNKRNNTFWNEKQVPFPYDPDDKDSLVMWLRDKYTGKFRYGSVSDSDYNLDDSWGDRTDDYGFDTSRRSSNGGKKSSRLSSALGLNYVGPTRRREQGSSSPSGKSFFENNESGHGYGYGGNRNSRNGYGDEPQLTRSMRRGGDRGGSSRYDSYDDDYNYPRSARSGRSSSRYSSPSTPPASEPSRPMRITHRKPTNSEFRKYGDQSRKMKFDMGYEDEDLNVEALVLTHGNVNRAVDLIKQSGGKPSVGGTSTSTSSSTPVLPQRKDTTGAIFDSTKAGGFNWLDDTTSAAAAASTTSTADNQIYQYVDPNTGAVYYIDANGQQYVDPNQQQQQQQQVDPFQLQQQQALQQQQLLQQQLLQQQALQQQQMMTGFGQPQQTATALSGREPTLNELAQQQQQQQQQQALQQQQLLLQQQQMMQQQQFQQQQQPNYFGGF